MDSPPSEAVTPPGDEPPAHVAKRQKVVHHREEEEVAHLLAGFASSSSRSQQLLPLQTSPRTARPCAAPPVRGPAAVLCGTPQPQWGDAHANRRRVEAAIAAADLEAPARPTGGGSGANQAERARQKHQLFALSTIVPLFTASPQDVGRRPDYLPTAPDECFFREEHGPGTRQRYARASKGCALRPLDLWQLYGGTSIVAVSIPPHLQWGAGDMLQRRAGKVIRFEKPSLKFHQYMIARSGQPFDRRDGGCRVYHILPQPATKPPSVGGRACERLKPERFQTDGALKSARLAALCDASPEAGAGESEGSVAMVDFALASARSIKLALGRDPHTPPSQGPWAQVFRSFEAAKGWV